MITSKEISNGILRAIAIIICFGLVLLFIYKIQTVLIYLIISLLLTLIANPLVEFLKKRIRFSNTLAVSTTLMLLITVVIGFVMMFIPLIVSQGKNLSLLNSNEIESNLLQLVNKMNVFFRSYNINTENLVEQKNLTSKINFDFIPLFLNSILETISNFGMGVISILFITFFFLKDKLLFISGIKSILPDKQETKILTSLDKINHMLSRYFIGLLIQLSIIFVMYLIVLLIFGIQNAFIIAFLCAVLNIVPYVGPLIGTFLAIILTMINNIGGDFKTEILPTTIYVLIGFTIVQFIDNNVSQPIISSKSVNSHPLEIFLVTIISGFLLGITGMIIAVPLYTMLKVILKEFFPENKIIQLVTKKI
jgi:predicted PurR-regulated permease PerM